MGLFFSAIAIATLAVWVPLGLLLIPALGVAAYVGYRVFENPFFGIVLVAVLLPFERAGSVDVGGMTLRLHQIVALLTLFAWFWRGIRHGTLQLRGNPLAFPLGAFVLVNVLSLINAFNLRRGLLVLAFTLFVIVVSHLVTELVRTKAQLKTVYKALLFSALFVSAFGLFQFIGDGIGLPASVTLIREHWYNKEVIGVTRVHAMSLEPLYFANYLIVIFPTLAAMIIAQARGKFRLDRRDLPLPLWQLIPGATAMGLAFILTLSRGGYLALAAATLVVLLLSFRDMFSKRMLYLVGIPAVALLLVGLVTGAAASALDLEFIVARSTSFAETSADLERLETYRDAWNAFLANPWLGFGPGNFGPYNTLYLGDTPDGGWGIVNNEYLELLAETGLFGFLALGVAVAVWLFRSFTALRYETDLYLRILLIGSIGSMAGLLVQYISFSTLYIMHLWFFIGFGLAVQEISLRRKPTPSP
jgi:O-antigen ligase